MLLAWSDVGWEGTCLEETPAALQEQSHPVCPWLLRSGMGGGWGLEDAWPDVATKVARGVVPQRCLLMSFSLPSCTPCGGTISSLRDFLLFGGIFALLWSSVCVCVGFMGVFLWGVVVFLLIKFCIL